MKNRLHVAALAAAILCVLLSIASTATASPLSQCAYARISGASHTALSLLAHGAASSTAGCANR